MNNKKQHADDDQGDEKLPGYPHYPADEDIYKQEEKTDFDDEGVPKKESAAIESELDIPATAPVDEDEIISEED
ncbi:MAG: hypothetical protein ABIN67_06720, partial [Ferruginibacter sp.]